MNELFRLGVFALGLMVWVPLSLSAEDDGEETEELEEREWEEQETEEDDEGPDEVTYPSQLETLRFLKEQVPIAVEMLELVKREEGEEFHEEVLEEYRERYFHYLEIRQYDGQEAASLHLAGVRIELRLDQAMHEYWASDEEEPEERAEIGERVQMIVREQLEHEKRLIRMELKLMRAHLQELEQELQIVERMGNREVDERVGELLGDDDEEEADFEKEEN
ncbi:MAG: hypothetical protein AAGC74_05675 [Verrucomicrobiota bacterium]